MSKTFKAAIYETHGNPAEVLRELPAVLDRRIPIISW
jgi:hypothetical protein